MKTDLTEERISTKKAKVLLVMNVKLCTGVKGAWPRQASARAETRCQLVDFLPLQMQPPYYLHTLGRGEETYQNGRGGNLKLKEPRLQVASLP